MERLVRICLPEMRKAFHFEARHTDRILIARYDDTGGYFHRHRDNVAPSVSFRQFALSVNLNSGYDGGYLQFPEFNSHRYRPSEGAGIIFSSSLLHEATPITRGSRYVLLTFFHNAEAQDRWLASGPA
jgi:predicted 2-oxoglutarate/Fe(II)-dependent dioxygenase YbiX